MWWFTRCGKASHSSHRGARVVRAAVSGEDVSATAPCSSTARSRSSACNRVRGRDDPQQQVFEEESAPRRAAEQRRLDGEDEAAVAPRRGAQRRGGVAARRRRLRPRRRRAEEVAVGLPCGEPGEVARQFPQQVEAPARITAMQRHVGVRRAVEVVVVQPVEDAVGRHRDPGDRGHRAARRVVERARRVEPVMRGVVGEHEQRVLPGGDQDHGGGENRRMAGRGGRGDRERDDRRRLRDRQRRAQGIEAAEALDLLRRQRAAEPEVVAEFAPGGGVGHAAILPAAPPPGRGLVRGRVS